MSSYYFTLKERESLMLLLCAGKSIKEISSTLKRNKSTIYRELQKNSLPDGTYSAVDAQEKFEVKMKHQRRPKKFVTHPELKTYVIEKLNKYWSENK